MTAQVNFGYRTGATLTYRAWSADGIEITIGATSLPEIDGGWYSVSGVNLSRGDVVVTYEGSNVVGFGEYQPEGLYRQISP